MNLAGTRSINYCNIETRREPGLHPDRTMAEHDLVCLLEGNWIIGQNGTQYPLTAGDVFFLPAGEHHYGVSNCTLPLRSAFIHFQTLSADQTYATPTKRQTETGVYLPTLIPCGSHPTIRRQFEELISGFWGTQPERQFALPAQLTHLLCELSQASREKEGEDLLINAALRLIHGASRRFISIDSLASTLGVSRRTVTRRFRAATGSSVHQYQLDFKLEKALLQLEHEPHYTLNEVASELGFYDEFHFARLFKRRYAISPGAVRKSKTHYPSD